MSTASPPFSHQRRQAALVPLLAPWLVALAAVTALGVVALGGLTAERVTAPPPLAPPVALHAGAPASAVETAFAGIEPYQVQRDLGASGGKAADCSIYSDGNLDDGVGVTWAVTLCVVHRTGDPLAR